MKNNIKYLFPSRKQRRNLNWKIAENKEILIYILLCPNYPNDGNRFIYENGQIGSELSHNIDVFKKKIDDDLLYILSKQKEFWLDDDLSSISLRPLVCEIESNLPNVIERFANWNLDFFIQQVQSTVTKTQFYFQTEYPNINVEAWLFHQALPNLSINQEAFEIKVQDFNYPKDFLDRCAYIARERTYMFEQLYWVFWFDDKIKIARRQMINYLAVTKSIAQKSPWALVINSPTPNLYYLESKKTSEVIWENEDNLPIFQII